MRFGWHPGRFPPTEPVWSNDLLCEIAAELETWEEQRPQAPRPLTRERVGPSSGSRSATACSELVMVENVVTCRARFAQLVPGPRAQHTSLAFRHSQGAVGRRRRVAFAKDAVFVRNIAATRQTDPMRNSSRRRPTLPDITETVTGLSGRRIRVELELDPDRTIGGGPWLSFRGDYSPSLAALIAEPLSSPGRCNRGR